MYIKDYMTESTDQADRVLDLAGALIEAIREFRSGRPELTQNEALAGLCVALATGITAPGQPEEQMSANLAQSIETLISLAGMVRSGFLTFNSARPSHD